MFQEILIILKSDMKINITNHKFFDITVIKFSMLTFSSCQYNRTRWFQSTDYTYVYIVLSDHVYNGQENEHVHLVLTCAIPSAWDAIPILPPSRVFCTIYQQANQFINQLILINGSTWFWSSHWLIDRRKTVKKLYLLQMYVPYHNNPFFIKLQTHFYYKKYI